MTKDEVRSVWESRVAAYKASGQSAKVWCADNSVNTSQLYYWLKKGNTPEQPTWLSVEIKEPCVDSSMNLKIGGVTVEVRPGFDPELLLKVVKTLTAVC